MKGTQTLCAALVLLFAITILSAQEKDALKFYGDLRLRFEKDYRVTSKADRDRTRRRRADGQAGLDHPSLLSRHGVILDRARRDLQRARRHRCRRRLASARSVQGSTVRRRRPADPARLHRLEENVSTSVRQPRSRVSKRVTHSASATWPSCVSGRRRPSSVHLKILQYYQYRRWLTRGNGNGCKIFIRHAKNDRRSPVCFEGRRRTRGYM